MSTTALDQFIQRIEAIPNVTVALWKGSALLCLFVNSKEFAHFHGQTALDIRITPKIITEEGLSRDLSARLHPKRSPKSRWIAIPCETKSEQDRALALIKRACTL